jgi:hypothetical protein
VSEELAHANSEGKLAKATGRVLVGTNQYAIMTVACHIRATVSSTEDDIERLGEQYLTVASMYALGLGRALAEGGTPPSQLDVDAECELDRLGGEPRISDLVLDVRGQVPGCDQQTFEAAAGQARLLQSAWALPATATVRVVARVDDQIDIAARTPSDVLGNGVTDASGPPDERPRARIWRRLVLLAAFVAAVLVYLAVGTPALERIGISRAQFPQEVLVGPFRSAADPTVTIAQVQTATAPSVPAASVASQPSAAPARPLAVQSAIPPSPTQQPAVLPGTSVPTVIAAALPSVIVQTTAGFEETFASNQRGWPDNPSSTAWLASGGYRLAPRTAMQFVAVRAPVSGSFRDIRVTGAFRKVGGPPGGGYGLILRDQSPAPLDGITQTGRYYVFEVGDRDGVGIWRREGDKWIDILPWTPSTAVNGQGGTNVLVAEARGTRLDFFVNDKLVASGEDAALAEGGVGVFTGGDGNDVLLTRFAVQPLS